ncbi:MAG: hypothetical protein Q9160_006091 [Pyrenula sp. 1 TL-2023]
MSESPFKLTSHLLSTFADLFQSATQNDFLTDARNGKVSKSTLSDWLTQDRLYISGYLHLVGRMLVLASENYSEASSLERKLVGLLSDALANVHREIRFFEDIAERYGLVLGGVEEAQEPVRAFRGLMALHDTDLRSSEEVLLVGLVVLYGTEICYLTAWRNAMPDASMAKREFARDADGGALRNEFIPNWTNPDFAAFVGRIAALTDEWWNHVLGLSHADQAELLSLAESKWKRLLEIEASFWPRVQWINWTTW